jgi:hypothetical protein
MQRGEEDVLKEELETVGEPMIIANEFAEVEVRKVKTRNGVRLEIRSPKLGYRVRLDSLELEALSWQPVETFSRLLETPWGPGGGQ